MCLPCLAASANPFEPVLRPAMQEMLERDFDPPLPCEPVRNNPGRLRVRAQDLVTWMNAQVRKAFDRSPIDRVGRPQVSSREHITQPPAVRPVVVVVGLIGLALSLPHGRLP